MSGIFWIIAIGITMVAVAGQFAGYFGLLHSLDRKWARRRPEAVRRAAIACAGLGLGLLALVEPAALALLRIGKTDDPLGAVMQHAASYILLVIGLTEHTRDYASEIVRSASSALERWAIIALLIAGILVTLFVLPEAGDLLVINAWVSLTMAVPIVIWQDGIKDWLRRQNRRP